MSTKDEALKLALDALEESLGYVEEEAENAQRLYGQYPTRQAKIQGLKDDARKHIDAITALREALAEQPAHHAVDWEKLYLLEVKKKNALAAKYERDTGTQLTRIIPMAEQPAQQQEPVAWMHWLHGPVRLFFNKDEAQMELERLNREYPVDVGSRKMRPLVFGDTSPPAQRKPLTVDEVWKNDELMSLNAELGCSMDLLMEVVEAIEAAHGIKGDA